MKSKLSSKLINVILFVSIGWFFVWVFQNGYFSQIIENPQEFTILMKQHLTLVGISSICAISVAIPSGIMVTRPSFKRLESFVSNLVNLGYTIPNMAVLALVMGILGIGFKTAVFALFLYSILPIFRNTVAGLKSINTDMIDAAKGMGLKPYQILFKIELPNAAYSIIAGVRTAVVINIGTTALAHLVGGGGLGDWVFTGIKLFDNGILLSGAIPITLLAIFTDQILRLVEHWLVPKSSKLAKS